MRVIEILRQERPAGTPPASSVDDFFYGVPQVVEGQGTGVRDVAKRFQDAGRILYRLVYLEPCGNALNTITVFRDEESFTEWCTNPARLAARERWQSNEMATGTWEVTRKVIRPRAVVEFS